MQRFPRGYYTYTGSAMGIGASSLSHRISWHLRKEKPKRWHIDYLLADKNATVTAGVAAQTNKKLECEMNRYIKLEETAKVPFVGFGASDCKETCGSHLLYFGEENIEPKIVMFYAKKLGPRFVTFPLK